MSESPQEPFEQERPGTGNEGVDAVVASLDGLDDLPVSDHVAVFERAHESLRAALTDAGDTSVPVGDRG